MGELSTVVRRAKEDTDVVVLSALPWTEDIGLFRQSGVSHPL